MFANLEQDTMPFQEIIKNYENPCSRFPYNFYKHQLYGLCDFTFGKSHTLNINIRSARFVEESIELFQGLGGSRELLDEIANKVYSNPPETHIEKEFGGVVVTLLALARAASVDLLMCGWWELIRFANRVDNIRERNKNKVQVPATFTMQEKDFERFAELHICDPETVPVKQDQYWEAKISLDFMAYARRTGYGL